MASHKSSFWILSGATLLWLLVFFGGPMGALTVAGFAEKGTPLKWALDFSAFGRLWDPVVAKALWRSTWMALVATTLCLGVSFPVVYKLTRLPPQRGKFFYFLIIIPLTANSLILTYSWMTLLAPDGWLERSLQWILAGTQEDPVRLLYTPFSVCIGLVYWYLPFMVYPLYSSMEKLDVHWIESSRDLGASRWRTFTEVIVPVVWPGALTGCLLVFFQSFFSFVVPELLGGSKTLMIGGLAQRRFLSLPQDWPMGAALSVSLIVVLGLLLTLISLGVRKVLNKKSDWMSPASDPQNPSEV